MKVTMNSEINGVDRDTLMETVEAIKAEPALGACRFRARNTWLGGNHNRTTVTGFHGAKQEIEHRQTFTMDADEPAILAGNDEAANPVEHLLHALASCLTTSMVAHAVVRRGIGIEELESELGRRYRPARVSWTGDGRAQGVHEHPCQISRQSKARRRVAD